MVCCIHSDMVLLFGCVTFTMKTLTHWLPVFFFDIAKDGLPSVIQRYVFCDCKFCLQHFSVWNVFDSSHAELLLFVGKGQLHGTLFAAFLMENAWVLMVSVALNILLFWTLFVWWFSTCFNILAFYSWNILFNWINFHADCNNNHIVYSKWRNTS